MRRWTLALAVIALAGCDKEQPAHDVRQADQELARDNLTSNDLTAIDAASGADSNMAADIDVANMALNLDEDGNRSTTRREPSARRTSPRENEPAASEPEGTPASTNDTEPPQPEDGAD